MSEDQAISIFALKLRSIGASGTILLLEADIKVGGWEFGLLITLTVESHLVRSFHSWFDHDSYASVLLLDRASIKSETILLVGEFLACTVVHLLECHIDSDGNIFSRLGLGLIQTSVCCTKVTAFNLKVGSGDLGQVSAKVEEWV